MSSTSSIKSVLCLVVTVGVAGCGGATDRVSPPRPDNPGQAELTGHAYGTSQVLRRAELSIGPDGIVPGNLTARAGTPISFTNDDRRTHRIVSTAESKMVFRSRAIAPGEKYRMTLEQTGRTAFRSTAEGDHNGFIDVFGGPVPELKDDPTTKRARQGWSLTPD